MPVDYFDTDDSQGLLGHFVGTVVDSFYSNDLAVSEGKAIYDGNDKTKLYWHVRVDDVLQEDYSGVVPETVTMSFGLGDKWWANEAGDQVRHEDDPGDDAVERGEAKPILFRTNSNFGKFLGLITGKNDAYRGDFGEAVALDGGDSDVNYDFSNLPSYMRRNKLTDTRESKIWQGLRFEFRGLGIKYRSTQGDPRMRALPVRYLGTDTTDAGVAVSPDSSAEASTPRSGPVTAETVSKLLPSDTPPDLVESITTLVSTSASHTEFMRNALMLDGVKGDEEINKVVKAAVMSEHEGPWAARGAK
jgi:hypothetical protein